MFIKSFCKSQFPHESVNFCFILETIEDKLTDLCGNGALQNNFIRKFCETSINILVGIRDQVSGLRCRYRCAISTSQYGGALPPAIA